MRVWGVRALRQATEIGQVSRVLLQRRDRRTERKALMVMAIDLSRRQGVAAELPQVHVATRGRPLETLQVVAEAGRTLEVQAFLTNAVRELAVDGRPADWRTQTVGVNGGVRR
eukprot:1083019-Alexandrium_andersonii.AAC.1